jgi:hypothetical protein
MNDWSSSENARIDPRPDSPKETDSTDLAHALVHQRQSLLISRDGGTALHALSERLQWACQALAPAARILHFSARQPAAWLGHINEGLALQGLDQAMQPRHDLLPQDIWFVHDAQALAYDEWLLVLRLNRHFPGWPLRWVLLLDSTQPLSAHEGALQEANAQGWRTSGNHRLWDKLAQSPETQSPDPVMETAPASASEPDIETRATSHPDHGSEHVSKQAGTLAVSAADPSAMLPEPSSTTLPLETTTSTQPGPVATTRLRQSLGLWTLGLLGLLAIGAWVVHQSPPQGRDLTGPLASSESTTAAEPSATPAVATVPTGTVPQNTDTQALSPALPGASTPGTEPAVTSNAPETSAPPESTVPEVARRDLLWLTTLPKDSFVLERGVFDSVQQAQRLIKAQDELATARIIMLRPGPSGTARFVVVTGPFRSLERAQNFRFRLQLTGQAPIEQVGLLLEKTMPLQMVR